ncbi:MAG: energy-coupling factor transporter transmembrane component T [Bacillota bacterium]|nr:energy-coupling factor transporter transmembrane component T [Bacillota bacterium]
MVRDITLGQFFPGNSILHRMDPRMKIILMLTLIIFIFITFNFFALGLVVATVVVIVGCSGVPVKLFLKSLKAVIFILLFTSVLNLFYGSGTALWHWGFLSITLAGIYFAIFISIRIIELIFISSSLTFTTQPTDLTDAIERLLKPLNHLHISVHEIAMMMTIALRFIPTLLEETDKIMSAQKARGADMESGNIVQRIKAMIPVLVPLFVSAFRRAYELAMAMECRCYRGGEGRTRMKQLHYSKVDFYCLGAVLIIVSGVILCNIFLPAVMR